MTLVAPMPPVHHIYMTAAQSVAIVDSRDSPSNLREPARRLVSTAAWRRLKDSMFSLIAGRNAGAHPSATLSDIGQQLAALKVPDEAAAAGDVLLFDHGDNVGRHLLAKGLLQDDLAAALNQLAATLRGAGLGRLRIDGVFHRTANIRLADAPSPYVTAFVVGTLHGSLSELFNSQVRIDRAGTASLTIRLGAGLDVNEQEKHDG